MLLLSSNFIVSSISIFFSLCRFLGNEPHHVLEDIYLARQYHGQDGLGGYLYGYNVPDIAKTEKKKPSGDLKGAYNYIAGDGQEIKVSKFC